MGGEILRRKGPSRVSAVLLFTLVALMAWGGLRLGRALRVSGAAGDPPPFPAAPDNAAEVFSGLEQLRLLPDMNSDGRSEAIAISAFNGGQREIALLVTEGDRYRKSGEAQRVQWPEGLPELAITDLPEAPGSLVVTMRLPGGEEQFQAFALDAASGLRPLDYYQLTAPRREDRNLVLVDKRLNVLYYYRNGALQMVARAATGADRTGPPGLKNRFTPEGRFRIAILQPKPSYTSPDGKKTWAGGDPDNPLGTRWMGFPVLEDDIGWIFGIQGTNEPEKLGTWSSDGSIRLSNPDAERLFDLIDEGTTLEIR